jgi:peroxiredoxin
MIDNADRLKPLLIGKKAPDLAMTTREGEDINLHDLNAKYTVLYFWRYDCAACKKSTPIMKEFYAEWKDRGVEIFSVCTKGIDELGDCWDYVDEHDIGNWVQVADPYQRYYKEYDIRSTPTIFLLDRDKTIVSKRIGAEQLDEVLSDLVKREEAETAGK